MIIMMISASRRKKGKGKVKPNRTFKKRPKLEEENEERKKGEKKERFGNPDKKKKRATQQRKGAESVYKNLRLCRFFERQLHYIERRGKHTQCMISTAQRR